jgi:uncharacterized protein (TIGR02217 family)
MSTQVLPSLIGLAWDVVRTPVWDTTVQTAISGKEIRIANQTYPRWKWELKYDVVRSDSVNTEFQQIVGFFNSRQGQFDTFLYIDADDNSVTSQAIGTGNGSTAAYQLVRALGGFVEPVLAPHTVSAVYLSGVSIPSAGYSAPTNGSLTQSAGGALGATTYYVKSTWVTNSGETAVSGETNLAVSANNVLTVAHPGSPPAGAIGWNVYVSNTGGGGSGAETRQNGGTPIAVGSGWTEPTSGLVVGAPMPGGNTTGWSVSNWGATTPGVLTFQGNVVNTIAITADFTYYWPVRMTDDSVPFNLFVSQFYGVKKFAFISCKG